MSPEVAVSGEARPVSPDTARGRADGFGSGHTPSRKHAFDAEGPVAGRRDGEAYGTTDTDACADGTTDTGSPNGHAHGDGDLHVYTDGHSYCGAADGDSDAPADRDDGAHG